MSVKRYEMLTGLYSPEQLAHMQRVRDALLADPTSLDNRRPSEDNDNGNEEEGR